MKEQQYLRSLVGLCRKKLSGFCYIRIENRRGVRAIVLLTESHLQELCAFQPARLCTTSNKSLEDRLQCRAAERQNIDIPTFHDQTSDPDQNGIIL
jgi:hypothetical protein